MAKLLSILAAVSLVGSSPALAAEPAWTDLFTGTNLDGWVQRGGKANYRVENGQIIGSSVPNTGNSFLCTERDFTNFVLELEFKTAPGLNSGVQIRSHAFEQQQQIKAGEKTIRVPAGRVHGYQVEIDPSSRGWSGGIYDEGRRGWLNDLKNNEPARKAYRKDDWNKFRIEAKGDSIKTWINGVPAADLKDSLTPAGFIALQVHGVGNRTNELQVRFRNIRLQKLP